MAGYALQMPTYYNTEASCLCCVSTISISTEAHIVISISSYFPQEGPCSSRQLQQRNYNLQSPKPLWTTVWPLIFIQMLQECPKYSKRRSCADIWTIAAWEGDTVLINQVDFFKKIQPVCSRIGLSKKHYI